MLLRMHIVVSNDITQIMLCRTSQSLSHQWNGKARQIRHVKKPKIVCQFPNEFAYAFYDTILGFWLDGFTLFGGDWEIPYHLFPISDKMGHFHQIHSSNDLLLSFDEKRQFCNIFVEGKELPGQAFRRVITIMPRPTRFGPQGTVERVQNINADIWSDQECYFTAVPISFHLNAVFSVFK
jgi:hypothetical protein